MSGRLVILPHKSWNVWNRDNREKVARDERIFQESEEAKSYSNKQLLQEQNLEFLLSKENKTENNTELEPFRLFGDLEQHHLVNTGNPEYLLEKELKEKLKKKRDGIEDWALGDGSYEKSRGKPWYETISNDTHINYESENLQMQSPVQREIFRKRKADPMLHILNNNKRNLTIKEVGGSSMKLAEKGNIIEPFTSTKEFNISEVRLEQDKTVSNYDFVNSNTYVKKRKLCKTEPDGLVSEIQSSGLINCRINNTGNGVDRANLIAKRLQRESAERKRAAILLATADIYGSESATKDNNYMTHYELMTNKYTYSQQYNPHLVRQQYRK